LCTEKIKYEIYSIFLAWKLSIILKKKWFGCDDSKFKEVPESLVMKSEAYLLFYRRIDDQSNNPTK